MHRSVFYIRDLSIQGFGYPQGSRNQSPVDTKGQLKFLGSLKLYKDLTVWELVPLTPVLFKDQLYIILLPLK